MLLESWEIVVFQFSLGSLLGGILLFIFSLFTAEFHFGGHEGAEINDFSNDTDLHFDGHFQSFGNIEADGNAGIDHLDSHDVHINKIDHNPSTPILLVLSTFLLMFGTTGTIIYQEEILNPFIRILLVLLVPIVFVKFISWIWQRLTRTEYGYEIPKVTIDNQVRTLTKVDEYGGLVLADTGDLDRPETIHSDEKMKLSAKTLPGVTIDRNSIAYIISIDEKNTLIIDLWPNQAKKTVKSTDN